MADPASLRALTALFLLVPETPLLFMGQEFSASSPFLFFTDHGADLAAKVNEGRKKFLSEFPASATREAQDSMRNPNDPTTFERCKLNSSERKRHAETYCLHRELLHLRRDDHIISRQDRQAMDGAVLGPQALALRWFTDSDEDRLLIVNLGPDLHLVPAPEPLLAPVSKGLWTMLWSSDHPRYGGPGILNPLTDKGWHVPGRSSVLFAAERYQGRHDR